MSSSIPIDVPAPFVPAVGLSFGQPGADAVFVDAANPMPVRLARAPAAAIPLAGTASASGRVGPFVPELDRPIHLTLSGSWSGTVRVLRSVDGGTTLDPLTLAGEPWAVFTTNANEPVAEESVSGTSYYVEFSLLSGAVTYRVAQ
ncbi:MULTISPECIES: hypothetical protein [Sphingomonas]|uniref:hypothetical protein n=1 Tax=Sphingomonas TaxID=13687 RepID=UPI000F7E7638|nr:hypothetical protein [Sphingomonas sp. ABOLF]RSV15443.1 hypothetical protein CA235_08705 [Sphingomonas sp. ABOLF]GLK22389.1 hypothetical protein GCM10017606_32170 [Microbacterium terregens]